MQIFQWPSFPGFLLYLLSLHSGNERYQYSASANRTSIRRDPTPKKWEKWCGIMARGGISALKLTWGPGGPKKKTQYLEGQRHRVPRMATSGTSRHGTGYLKSTSRGVGGYLEVSSSPRNPVTLPREVLGFIF